MEVAEAEAEAAFLYSKLASALMILNPHCPESPGRFHQSLLWARTTAPRQDVPFGHFLVRQAVGPLPTLLHFHGISLWTRTTAPTSHIGVRCPYTVSAPCPAEGGPPAYPPAPLLPFPWGPGQLRQLSVPGRDVRPLWPAPILTEGGPTANLLSPNCRA